MNYSGHVILSCVLLTVVSAHIEYHEITDWVKQPGKVHVCDGDTARPEWISKTPIVNYTSKLIGRKNPYEEVISRNKQRILVHNDKRADFLNESNYRHGFTLKKIEPSDSGFFYLTIRDDSTESVYLGKAEIVAIESSVCPDRHMYLNPSVQVSGIPGEQTSRQMCNNSYLDLSQPGDITILVTAPAATPPVLVTLIKDGYHSNCSASSDKDEKCSFDLPFSASGEIFIKQTFPAFQPSIIAFDVKLNEKKKMEPMTPCYSSTMPTYPSPLNQTVGNEDTYYTPFVVTLVCLILHMVIMVVACIAWKPWMTRKPTTHSEDPTEMTDGNGLQKREGANPPKQPRSDLHRAAKKGLLKLLTRLCNKDNVDLNILDEKKRTPLGCAARKGHVECVKLLINFGADVNEPRAGGQPPLHCAVGNGHNDVAKVLLENGAFVNLVNNLGLTPMHCAADASLNDILVVDIAELLINFGADIQASNRKGDSPVHLAVHNNGFAMVRLLHRSMKNSGVTIVNGRGDTPLHTAVELGNGAMVTILSGFPDGLNEPNDSKDTALHIAVKLWDLHIVEFLASCSDVNLKALDKHGQTALAVAAGLGFTDAAEILIDKRANLDHPGSEGVPPLHAAVAGRHLAAAQILLDRGADVNLLKSQRDSPLHIAVDGKDENMIELLCRYNVDVNIVNMYGYTPVHSQVIKRAFKMVCFLYKMFPHAKVVSQDGDTPLHLAIQKEDFDMCELLCGLNPSSLQVMNKMKETPLRVAIEKCNPDIVTLLCNHDADVNENYSNDGTPLHLAVMGRLDTGVLCILLENGAKVDKPNGHGQSPLGVASGLGATDKMQILVARNANVNFPKEYGKPPLHHAIEKNQEKAVNFLLEKGANLDVLDVGGRAPLGVASETGNMTIIGELLVKGAKMNYPGMAGKPPLHCAVKGGKLDVIKFLVGRGADLDTLDYHHLTARDAASKAGNVEIERCLAKLEQERDLKMRGRPNRDRKIHETVVYPQVEQPAE